MKKNTAAEETRKTRSPRKEKTPALRSSAPLPTLQSFFRTTRQALSRSPGGQYVVIHWDIDSFKVFNNVYGTEEGDRLIHEIARRCALLKRKDPNVISFGYMGADHFLLCLKKDGFDPEAVWKQLSALVQESFPNFSFSIKCGLREMENAAEVDVICEQALLALRSIKSNYEVNYAWYEPSMLEKRLQENEIITDMHNALERGDFVPYFQPQYNHISHEIIGMEALARWQHPQKGLLSPAVFIPVFERNGFIFEMDKCIWDKACACLRRWMDAGLEPPPLSVNVSRKSLYHPSFIPALRQVVEKYRIASDMLHLEITESAYMENKEQLLSIISRLHDLGFRVEMDDFGSGYSSLNCLKDVPVDLIKLDTEFLSMKNCNRGKGGNILSSVIRLAHGINLDIIAEGVEDKNQADLLKSLGCVEMQGYYFARPMPEKQFTDLLREGKVAHPAEETGAIGVDRAVDFLDDSTQSALLFNSFVGGAAIMEYRGDTAAILRANDKFLEQLGVPLNNYREMQLRVLEVLSDESRSELMQQLETAIRTGQETACEVYVNRMLSGLEPVWLYCRMRFLAKKVDSYLFYLAVDNISRRKALEENNRQLIAQLDAKMQQQEHMMDHIPAAIALLRIKDGRLYCERLSRGAKDLLLFGKEDADSLDMCRRMERLTEEAESLLDEEIRLAQAGAPRPFTLDLYLRTDDGSDHWLNLSASPQTDEDGKLFFYGIYTDVTQRKCAEQTLALREAEYRSVVSQSRKVICRYHPTTRRFSMLEDSAALLGLPPVLENGPEAIMRYGSIAPASCAAWTDMFEKIHSGIPCGDIEELEMVYRDGTHHWYSAQFSRVDVDGMDTDTVTLAFENITEKRAQSMEKSFEYDAMFRALHRIYPLTMTCNLTKNHYSVLENGHYLQHHMGSKGNSGSFDQLILDGIATIPENERELFLQHFSRESLLCAFAAGQDTVELEHHQYSDDGQLHWIKTTVLRVDNPHNEDILEMTMSQCIDQRKQDEENLKNRLSAASSLLGIKDEEAELRIILTKLGRTICRYDWETDTLILPEEHAKKNNIPREVHLSSDVESEMLDRRLGVHAARYKSLGDYFLTGVETGVREMCYTEDGTERWEKAEFVTLFDEAKKPVRTIISLKDTTASHQKKEEELSELRFSEHVMRLVAEHSGRIVYYLDLETETIDALDAELCEKNGLPHSLSIDSPLLLRRISIAQGDDIATIVNKIKSGVPRGELKAQIRGRGGKQRWYDIHYSTLWNSRGDILGAVISLLDVTQLHKQELAYARYRQLLSGEEAEGLLLLEADLTADTLEQLGGNAITPEHIAQIRNQTYSQIMQSLLDTVFTDENRAKAATAFDRTHLLNIYTDGIRDAEEDWHVLLPGRTEPCWLRISLQLIKDSYTGHIRAYITMNDITKEKEDFLRVQHRAERDGLTGVYNRASIEMIVNEYFRDRSKQPAVMLLLDLDELKVINDRYGHQNGDYVLRQLCDILTDHFGQKGFVGRVGGDEFVVFLPDVDSEAELRASVQAMMDKLLGVLLGDGGEFQVHCSAGGAFGKPGVDDFDTLYRHADIALYHIKRNGKNDYLLFTEEMLQENFQYHGHREVTLRDTRLFSTEELSVFLSMIAELYPMVISMNLSRNTIYQMESRKELSITLPKYGTLTEFFTVLRRSTGCCDWVEPAPGETTREQLMNAYLAGQKVLRFINNCRSENGSVQQLESNILMYRNSTGDICGFAMTRPIKDDPSRSDTHE